jgi:MCM AAA-lid domain
MHVHVRVSCVNLLCLCRLGAGVGVQVYAKLRKESAISAGMPIAVRHLESMIRMSEAHAKMHLRSQVSDADIDTAVRCDFMKAVPMTMLQFCSEGHGSCCVNCVSSPGAEFDFLISVLQGHGAELRVDTEAERAAVHDAQVRAVRQHAGRQLRAGADGAARHAARPGAPRGARHDARRR